MTEEAVGAAETEQTPEPRVRGPRIVLLVAGAAVLALVAGLVAGRFVLSPSEAAARVAPPKAGPVTAPVEKRRLSNDVVLRADAAYADAVDLRVETGELAGPAVVTGHVPKVGDQVGPASVLLEIAGRPVIVLPGDLPAYRTMRVGMAGPDVLELKAALASLGIDPGDATSDVYDAATAAGVDALYSKVGYASPTAGDDAQATLETAVEGVTTAKAAVREAEAALAAAGQGATDVQKLEADNRVRAAQRQLEQAQAAQAAAASGPTASGEPAPTAPVDVAGAQDELTLAQAQRAELDNPPDTTGQAAALQAAKDNLANARRAADEAQTATLTALPESEVAFVAGLPRRVDAVKVTRGGTVDGVVVSVSGADLTLKGNASGADAALMKAGGAAEVTLPDGSAVQAEVASIGKAAQDRVPVVFRPHDLTQAQSEALRGQNVRVKVSVGATDGEVMVVPLAALTAGPGGESRVEVQRPGAADTDLVTVTPGLRAQGFVEIKSADGALAVGDHVVVGR